jgi:hypothetical protein
LLVRDLENESFYAERKKCAHNFPYKVPDLSKLSVSRDVMRVSAMKIYDDLESFFVPADVNQPAGRISESQCATIERAISPRALWHYY